MLDMLSFPFYVFCIPDTKGALSSLIELPTRASCLTKEFPMSFFYWTLAVCHGQQSSFVSV